MTRRLLLSLLCCLQAGCAFLTQIRPSWDWDPQALSPNSSDAINLKGKSYVSIDFSFAPYEELRKKIEQQEGLKLKHRGEAHLTLITPPELQVLRQKLSDKELESLLNESHALKAPLQALCIGVGEASRNATYFIVLKSPELRKFRQKLQKLFQDRGGKQNDFNSEVFYPHITLGFTERDLHIQDGVLKDENTCRYKLKTKINEAS